jgi:DNA polymerase-1
MLINADVKSLEVVVAAELSDDKILKDELIQKLDLHANNQARFKLPDRVTAKRFIFKLLYGATAYGYATDPDFFGVGYSARRWQAIIDEFYNKYKGIALWHQHIIKEAMYNGFLEIPSGRYYSYSPTERKGEIKWPLTTIKNYPVQGFGADLVKLARVEFFKRFKESQLEGEFICTIHDSLVVDTPSKNVYNISCMLRDSIEAVPQLCKEYFNYDFSLPLTCEILVGQNKLNMEEIKL